MPEIKAIRRGRPVLIPAGELERWVEKTRSRCCRQVHKGRRRLALAGRSVWLLPRRRMAATTSPQGLVRSHRGWSLARGLGDTPSASDHRFPSGSVRGGPNRRHWPCGSTFRADTLRRMRRGRALSRWCAVGGVAVVAIVAVQGASGSADRASALPGRPDSADRVRRRDGGHAHVEEGRAHQRAYVAQPYAAWRWNRRLAAEAAANLPGDRLPQGPGPGERQFRRRWSFLHARRPKQAEHGLRAEEQGGMGRSLPAPRYASPADPRPRAVCEPGSRVARIAP
jgi:hypothetical protein